jgi:hypothetical protein
MFEILNKFKFFYNLNIFELFMSDTISEPNKHIEEYLHYYCEDNKNDYAVLINGNWGAGKTWFIKQFEELLKKNNYKRVIYISLNGVSKKEAIDDQIFCALHPILSHRATRFIGKVATGLVKASTKIDLNNDGHKDETLSISLPSVDVDSVLKKGEKLILIFDDLERCLMPISETLGYINYFVEHTNSKAIILANEEHINKNKENSNVYLNEKEKLVGASFEFKGDINNALEYFIKELRNSEVEILLSGKSQLILDIYNSSKYNNIRSLKQTIREFSRFYNSGFFKEDGGLLDIILKNYFIFSLEFRNNGFNGNILEFKKDKEDAGLKKEKDSSDIFYNKYGFSKYSEYVLSKSTWNNIIVKNIVDLNCINNELNTNYFTYKLREMPVWLKLWYYYDIGNGDFDLTCKVAIEKVKNSEWKEIGEVLHVFSAIIFFNKMGVLNEDLDEMRVISFDNIENICKTKDKEFFRSYKLFNSNDNWGGYSFLGYDNVEFKDFIIKLNEFINNFEIDRLESESKGLIELMSSDSTLFYHRMCLTNSSDNYYYNVPILKEIRPNDFVDKLINLKLDDYKNVIGALRRRYNVDNFIFRDIEIEEKWLIEVKECLVKIAAEKTGIEKLKIDTYPIKQIDIILESYFENSTDTNEI